MSPYMRFSLALCVALFTLFVPSADAHRRHLCCTKYITDVSSCVSSCEDSACEITSCYCTGKGDAAEDPESYFFDSLHPGLLLEHVNSSLVVASVLPGSPAELSGMRPGDEILEINGEPPFDRSEHNASWEHGGTGFTMVRIARDKHEPRNIAVPLVSIRHLLEAGWSGPREPVPLVRVGLVEEDPPALGTYLFGLRLTNGRNDWAVHSVLTGSPAYLAGLKGGERILEINGQSPTATTAKQLTATQSESRLELKVVGGSGTRIVTLTAMRVTQILRNMAERAFATRKEIKLAGL